MKRRVRGTSLALGVLMLASFAAFAQQDDVESRAMRDEMQRSMKELHLDGSDGPYYVSYKIVDTDRKDAQASFGALVGSAESHTRSLSVSVRVGSYQYDNSGGPSGGAADIGAMLVSMVNNQLPLDDNYNELRRKIWLATDSAYKRAVEQLSAKKARDATRNAGEGTASFSKESAHHEQQLLPPIDLNLTDAEHLVRAASEVFRRVPLVETSSAQMAISNSTEHFLDSEGTTYVRRIPNVSFHAMASVQTRNGELFNDSYAAYGRSLNELPKQAELIQQAQLVADRLTSRPNGKVAKRYTGPVLVEGDAAAELFAHHFINTLASRPSGGSGGGGLNAIFAQLLGGQAASPASSGMLNKIGSRVLPTFLSVTDDPRLTQAEGQTLFGSYTFDEEGTPSQETVLVKDGMLKTLLTSRTPVRGLPQSTGNMRNGGIYPGNVLVTASQPVNEDDLKKQLLDLVKTRNLDSGMIVRRLAGDVALDATRIFPDGREEDVRDARITEVDPATFKDVLAVSNKQAVYTDVVGGNLVTYVVPAMLFEDMTVERMPNNALKRPDIPNPLAAGE